MNVNCINVITLAYIGDAVFEVYIREEMLKKGIVKVEELQKEVTKYVSAKGQAKILDNLLDNNFLTTEEVEVIKRGRNYKK